MNAASASDRLVLLDGYAIVHRSFFAQRDNPLSVHKTGEIVTAVYGFANTLFKVLNDLRPTHVAVAMDTPGPTFRDLKDETYKAHRPPMPTELRSQFARVRQLISTFNIPIYEAAGFEADDVLGTLARQASDCGLETYLATLDSDILQLVRPDVFVYMYRLYQRDTVIYDEHGVEERYGVRPSQIPDLKALKGDTSDNIAGVPGIGEKTAVKLLQAFGTVAGVYENLESVQPARTREQLRPYADQAVHSLDLATIVDNAPVILDLAACEALDYDREQLLDLFRELEFRSLLDRLPPVRSSRPAVSPSTAGQEEQTAAVYQIIDTEQALAALVEEIRAAGTFAFSAETTSGDALRSSIVGISIAVRPGAGFYIPLGHASTLLDSAAQLPVADVAARLKPVFENPTLHTVAHNAKFSILVLRNLGIEVGNLAFDTMIAAFLLGEHTLGLKPLVFDRLHEELAPLNSLTGTGAKQVSIAQVGVDKVAAYAAANADMTLRLFRIFETELRERGLWSLFADVELPLVSVLSKMELAGVAVDVAVLREQSQSLGVELQRLEAEIYASVGHQFNINSPKQLSSVMFVELNLGKTRKTSQGFSTNAAALEYLRDAHPMISLLLDYRQLSKLKSTYLDSLPGLIDPRDGRVHTSFNQCGAATGRMSSSEPNLQNIPVRTALGRNVRRAFIARMDGRPSRLVSADYSQIELRILAHISQEPHLVEAFVADEDIHSATAADLFAVDITAVTFDQRRLAKTINFATIYGLSAQGLAQRTELSNHEAAAFIKAYFEKYPGIDRYIKETVSETRELGYAETLLGRRRYIPDIRAGNFNVRSAAERMAVNHPIQGSNADIIKIAMRRIQSEIEERALASRMILQVHDELIFECPDEEVDTVAELARRLMPASIELSVPVKVDIKVGANWAEIESVTDDLEPLDAEELSGVATA